MKKYLSNILLLLVFVQTVHGQTENFEDETLNSNSFTFQDELYILDGFFRINESINFSCDSSNSNNKYMDTGRDDGPSFGFQGGIVKQDGGIFRVSTSSEQCIWVGSNDGQNLVENGILRISGGKPDNSTIVEEFTITTDSFNSFVTYSLSPSLWRNVDLVSLSFENVTANIDYVAIDNIVFDNDSLSIDENVSNNVNVRIFPNPTSSRIGFIGGNGNMEDYYIVDCLGKVLQTGNIILSSNDYLNLEHLDSGLYYLIIKNLNFKIIKN